ncbi:MAG: type I methionyl aminopeptidase [Patescibacteria group bacterium]
MSSIKQPEELKLIQEGGEKIGAILAKLAKMAAPGVTLAQLDAEAERLIIESGGVPSFKGYKARAGDTPFPSTICACVNEELVHAPANRDRALLASDILSIDIGMQWPAKDGFFTDTALTIPLGPIKKEVELLLERTQKALEIGIAEVRPGKTIADIGRAIEDYLKPFGYGIVRALVGHGVGYKVHEPPQVPNYYQKALENVKIEPGMVLALEPMVTLGTHEVKTLDDGWTIVPVDNSMCAHFEHTVIATDADPVVVTRRPDGQ